MALSSPNIKSLFSSLDRIPSLTTPHRGALSQALRRTLNKGARIGASASIAPVDARLFISAAVEMWQRGIHSLLISVAVTKESSLWATVGGYYASHYVMRAVCHLYGHVSSHEMNAKYELEYGTSNYKLVKKNSGSNEHDFYWACAAKLFPNHRLFNAANPDKDQRHCANYRDHVNHFDALTFDQRNQLTKEKIDRILLIEPESPEKPDDRYPDVLSLQTLALHRLCFFRNHLDTDLNLRSKYWLASRNPSWCEHLMSYDSAFTDTGSLAAHIGDSINL